MPRILLTDGESMPTCPLCRSPLFHPPTPDATPDQVAHGCICADPSFGAPDTTTRREHAFLTRLARVQADAQLHRIELEEAADDDGFADIDDCNAHESILAACACAALIHANWHKVGVTTDKLDAWNTYALDCMRVSDDNAGEDWNRHYRAAWALLAAARALAVGDYLAFAVDLDAVDMALVDRKPRLRLSAS